MTKQNHSPATDDDTRPLRSSFLMPIAVVFAAFWTVSLSLIILDPLDIYDWGKPPKLLPNYTRGESVHLFGAASRVDVDTLALGGSTFWGVTAERMIEAFPKTQTAFNFSINGPRPADRKLTFDLVAENSPADHFIIALDWIYALPSEGVSKNGLPTYLFDDTYTNDLRIASPKVLALTALNYFRAGRKIESKEYANKTKTYQRIYERFQSRENLEKLATSLVENPLELRLPNGDSGCTAFPAVTQTLIPFVQTMVSKGRSVDLIIPPYALAQYRLWPADRDDVTRAVSPFLPTQIAMRRCVAELTDPIQNTRLFAFDNLTDITGDLSNYRDLSHLQNSKVVEDILQMVATGDGVLNLDTFSDYERDLIANVESFRVKY